LRLCGAFQRLPTRKRRGVRNRGRAPDIHTSGH